MIITKNRIGIGALAAIIAIASVSCNMTKKYEREEKEKIQNYLTEHPEYDFVLKESGLYYHDITIGTGLANAVHDTVYVKYSGKFLDGDEFDSNLTSADSLIFPNGEGIMIPGFEEGISYMKVGGRALLLLPSNLAFGNSSYLFPAWTPVIFEVRLLKVVPSAGK
jgi:FKBP-type peptidyl-prolyl cis-trans isomerase